MNRLFWVLCLVLLGMPAVGFAATVAEGTITSDVVNREPIDHLQELPAGATRVYCFTRVMDAADGGVVVHTWYWGGREMARVKLPVRSEDWRTWSSKNILPQWHGDWRVDVSDADGKLLQSISFKVP